MPVTSCKSRRFNKVIGKPWYGTELHSGSSISKDTNFDMDLSKCSSISKRIKVTPIDDVLEFQNEDFIEQSMAKGEV